MSAYILKNIEKVYNQKKANEVKALNGINLQIDEGEMLGITGESGSGKSTLLHLLGGLDAPTQGEVLFADKKINYGKKRWLAHYRNKEVGFVLQDFGLIMSENVLENVSVPLYFSDKPMKDIKKAAYDALKTVGIENLFKRNVSELSGGQMQRTAIARALVNNPGVILADEPTGALDKNTTASIMDLLVDLNKAGRTLVIVTHDPYVSGRCKRVIELSDGKISDRTV